MKSSSECNMGRSVGVELPRRGFDHVDATHDPGFFLQYLDQTRMLPALQEIEHRIVTEVGSVGATRIVEVGCGTGELLARMTPTSGHGFGIEKSVVLCEAAQRRHAAHGNLSFIVHDFLEGPLLSSLPIQRPCDALVINRVLQHISNPRILLANAARCLRAGSLVILSDVDWSRMTISHPDTETTAQIIGERCRARINPAVGSALQDLCGQFCLGHSRVVADIQNEITEFGAASNILGFRRSLDILVANGTVTEAAASAWTQRGIETSAAGTFRSTLFHRIACATL